MKILLLGGTAFFGRDITRYLQLMGHSVTRFTRGNREADPELNVPHIKGDRANIDDLKRAAEAEKWDAVIDNIAYDGKAVENAVKAFRSVGRYILTSTISVYRYMPRHSQPLQEGSVDFDYRPSDENLDDVHWKYARGKLDAETTLVRQDKVPWTILRPSVVYGPNDVTERGFWYLARILDKGPILVGDGGSNSIRLTFSWDLCQVYLSVLQNEHSTGKIYNIAQDEIITLKDFIKDSASALGVKPQLVSVPYASLGDLGGPYAYDRNWIPDISAAKRDLNYTPTPWADFSGQVACWFRDCWAGDKSKLFATRKKELDFAAQWAKAASLRAG